MPRLISNTRIHRKVKFPYVRAETDFWGVCCDGGKAYKQVVNSSFHVTKAVLDPGTFDGNNQDRTVTLSVMRNRRFFLLCVLKHGEKHHASLDLTFAKGSDVTFSVHGSGTVHLTGYQLMEDSNYDMDNELYNSKLGSDEQNICRLRRQLEELESGRKAKTKTHKKVDDFDDDDDDDEEDDSDFSASAFRDEEESSSDELSAEDVSEEEIEALKQELKEEPLMESTAVETPLRSKKSQKRKFGSMSPLAKRVKIKTEETDETSDDDDESESDKGDMNSSIGNTPMPKKKDDSAKAKKKNKKKKRLSQISNIAEAEKENDDSSLGRKNSMIKSEKRKHPISRHEGGVECQDVTIGKGPVATKGKIVSIFYLGRLGDKTIFDSRTAPKKPFTFKLGVPEVIKGLDVGVHGMKVGGRRKLKVPSKMGYGTKDMPNVPPNSTLYFNVELVSVN